MNRRLSERRIRSTCQELVAARGKISGRELRRVLKDRFGAVGKTERVFQIWREETGQSLVLPPPIEAREMHERMLAAESSAAENLARAERAEFREQAHQDHWAAEIDRARRAGGNQPEYAVRIRELEEQVFRLSRELDAARGAIQRS
jgi:hypothetical protein